VSVAAMKFRDSVCSGNVVQRHTVSETDSVCGDSVVQKQTVSVASMKFRNSVCSGNVVQRHTVSETDSVCGDSVVQRQTVSGTDSVCGDNLVCHVEDGQKLSVQLFPFCLPFVKNTGRGSEGKGREVALSYVLVCLIMIYLMREMSCV